MYNDPLVYQAGIETLIIAVVFTAAASVAYSGYQKAKKAARAAAERQSGLLYQTKATAAPRRLVYGQVRLGALELSTDISGTDNEFLHFILYWCEGEINAVSKIYFDGVEVPLDGSGDATGDFAGFVHVESKLGTSSQTTIADAATAMTNWNTYCNAFGCAISWVRLKYDQDKFPNGVPSISALIQGTKNIVDPTDDSTGYTSNCALCMIDYMTDARFGMGLNIDDDFIEDDRDTCINTCEQDVSLSGGGTEKRYTFNGVIQTDEEPESVLDRFLTAMAGNRVYTNGGWSINAGEYFIPTFEIDESMIVGDLKFTTKVARMDRINEIRGVYAAAQNNYFPTDFPAYTNSAYVTADGETLPEDVELIDTNSVTMARRLAKIFLLRARYERKVTVQCSIEAMQAMPGKTVKFTYPKRNFDETPMNVTDFGLVINDDRTIQVNLELTETNSAVYAWDSAEDEDGTQPAGGVISLGKPSNNFGASSGGVAGGLSYSSL